MLKAIKLRIYPNHEQISYINRILGSCRFIYNHCLAYKIEKYNDNKQIVTFGDIGKRLTELKKLDNYLSNYHYQIFLA